MKSGAVHFLRRIGKRSTKLRVAMPALDRLATWWLESQFLALSGRPSGALSVDRCRDEYEDARNYRALHASMDASTPASENVPDPMTLDSTGMGQFTSRVLDVADLEEPGFLKRYSDLGFLPENQHRKAWEITYVSLLADHFGAGGGSGLGLGVAHEELLFHFANVCERVVGIDLYNSLHWEGAALSPEQVYDLAPFPYRRERLKVQHMDMRALEFPPDSFDFVWSISVIEHVDSIAELETVFEGIHRVLKPGGHAFLTTEWNMVADNPRYVPGLIVFDEPLVRHLLAATPGLELLGPMLTRQSESDLHTYHVHWTSNRNTEVRPLYNIFTSETFCTPVVLVLRKRALSP